MQMPTGRDGGRRAPGRQKAGTRPLTPHDIFASALELSKRIPLHEMSIVRLASALGVTPASIHYHLDGRDAVVAGVIDLFIRDLLDRWPSPTGNWRADLEGVADALYRQYLRYPGVTSYFALHNRFLALKPVMEEDDGGGLLLFMERYFAAVRAVGLEARRSATYAVLLLQFIHVAAHRTANHQWPGEQAALHSYLTGLDRSSFPSIDFMRESYLELAGDAAFEAGLRLISAGLEMERRSARTP
ncbi:MAG: putative transcriptional regulator, TetR term domain [Rhodospirillales bacterium]|jgi:AcrR family transcriptional regulator|nr:putative transcriptional regulator, TetR term domain [Rhodospirillales bacterium]